MVSGSQGDGRVEGKATSLATTTSRQVPISAGDISRLADRDTMNASFKRIEPGMEHRGELEGSGGWRRG
ncbi:MAG: hypothetical protein LUQ44_07690 [Methanothrix sp.]|nr:hypothetical protein [Methanothrix sp.]